MKLQYKIIALMVVLTGYFTDSFSQTETTWKSMGQFNVGCNINLNFNKGQHFPGIRIFAIAGINGVYKDWLLLNYGFGFSLYTKTLGANLNPLLSDVQLDFTNALSFGYGWGDYLNYVKLFRTINNSPGYNFATRQENAVILTSQLILNSSKRNQIVGAINISTKSFTLNYYNDSGPIIEQLSLGDEFDRWWTGGFGIYVHTKNNYNKLEFSFDQFTGYAPLIYELSGILGISVPQYPEANGAADQKQKTNFNTSSYNLRYFPSAGVALDLGILGSLRDKQDRAYGFQELTHIWLNHALHPNSDVNRWYIGGDLNYFQYEDFKK